MILCDGCFDPVHVGHVQYLRAAYDLCQPQKLAGSDTIVAEVLVVNVATDDAILAKGRKPFQDRIERTTMLSNFVPIAQTTMHHSLADAVHLLKPRLLVKGWDWIGKLPQDVVDACASVGAAIVYVPTQGRTSTERLSA